MKKLTIKTFLIFFFLSLVISISAYSCICFSLSYTNKVYRQQLLDKKTKLLLSDLRETKKQDSEQFFIDFIKETGADLILLNQNRERVSLFTFQKDNQRNQNNQNNFNEKEQPFRFLYSLEEYILKIHYNDRWTKEIKTAIFHSMAYSILIILLMSFLCAFFFSRYTTKPIQRISKIANKMAGLDFSWYCPDVRDDEIGMLSKSINELSDKLHQALTELYHHNTLLQDEIAMEKERERRRMLFFSGVSHELKTPIAILIGQLEGMLYHIGVYADREKYLARGIEILQGLNHFIKEILFVSHIDIEEQKKAVPIPLSDIVKELLCSYFDYAELSSIKLIEELEADISIYGEETLLKKALGNVISNAIMHSLEYGSVSVKLYHKEGNVVFTVFNEPAHIEKECLFHIFEAFYRGNSCKKQGSGLGLYITRMILEAFQVWYSIENKENGVVFTAIFQDIYTYE